MSDNPPKKQIKAIMILYAIVVDRGTPKHDSVPVVFLFKFFFFIVSTQLWSVFLSGSI